MIAHDPNNPNAVRLARLLEGRPGVDPADPIVVIGGDGFLLQTVSRYGYDPTYLPLNAGHLGFLLNDVDDGERVAERIRDRKWTAWRFPLLGGKLHLADGRNVEILAMNDLYLERMTGQTARLSLSIDGHKVVDHLVADGIVFSTALGSTAYNFSAGGPAAHPTLRVMFVTPICPHHPKLAPIALPGDAKVVAEIVAGEHRPVRAVADGRQIDDVRKVEVSITDRAVSLAYFDGHDFTSRMIRKLLHP